MYFSLTRRNLNICLEKIIWFRFSYYLFKKKRKKDEKMKKYSS